MYTRFAAVSLAKLGPERLGPGISAFSAPKQWPLRLLAFACRGGPWLTPGIQKKARPGLQGGPKWFSPLRTSSLSEALSQLFCCPANNKGAL